MKHPVFQSGFRAQALKARQYYNGRFCRITGPDGRTRVGEVKGTIIDENVHTDEWEILCYFRMERLDGSDDPLEADWARTYLEVHNPMLEWVEAKEE